MPADPALKRLAAMRHPGNWIIAALESVQASEGSYRKDPGWFHPSGLSDECDAKLAFQFLGAPGISSIAARLRRIFDNGSGRDEYLKRDMNRSGVSLIDPTKLVEFNGGITEADRVIEIPQYRIRGELDDWVQNPLNGERYIIDYKTMRDDLWKDLQEALPSHHIQVHPYMFAKETYKAFILYENKNDQEFKLKPADWDNAIWDRIVYRTTRIIELLEQDIVERTPGKCSSCPFFANGVCGANQIRALRKASGLYA